MTGAAEASPPLYKTSFERPRFDAGALLDDQGGWTAYSGLGAEAAFVTADRSSNGAQSVLVEGSLLTQDDTFWLSFYDQPPNSRAPERGERYITVSADVWFDPRVTPAGNLLSGYQIIDNSNNFVGWMSFFLPAGTDAVLVWCTGGFDPVTGEQFDFFAEIPDFDPGRFYEFRTEIDLVGMRISFFLDGDYLESVPIAAPFDGTFQLGSMFLHGYGAPTVARFGFDNYRVTAAKRSSVPKPPKE